MYLAVAFLRTEIPKVLRNKVVCDYVATRA